MKQKLILVTDNFPFGYGEASFILPELQYLYKNFDILIISKNADGQRTSNVLPGINVCRCSGDLSLIEKIRYSIPAFFDREFYFELKRAREKGVLRSGIRHIFASYAKSCKLYDYLREQTKNENSNELILLYSYWYNYAVKSLVKLKKSRFPKAKVITRVHGYDLYDERAPLGYHIFRKETEKNIDKIIFACREGMQYYLNNHLNTRTNQCMVSYLGTSDGKFCKRDRKNKFILVSCSNLIGLKRVSDIIEALASIEEFCIKWIHFGDGILMDELETYAEELFRTRPNIEYEFKGLSKSEQIKQYYENNQINCFITLSSSEGGAPVSIMEALSFGIPVIGTSVGGIPEEIDEENGILLSKNPTTEEVAAAIEKIHNMDDATYNRTCLHAFNTWKEKFDANKNSKKFVEILQKIGDM